MKWVTALAFSLLVILEPAVAAMPRPMRALSCATRSISLDTTLADALVGIYLGRSYGQTFTTADTLIESITIWRGAGHPGDTTPLRMFITEVDSTGKPDVFQVLNSDPVIEIPTGDGVHATPGTWSYSPPLNLPHRGMFCFAVHDDLYCEDAMPFLANGSNPYPGGNGWQFAENPFCNLLGPPFSEVGDVSTDMIFTIDFCDTSTPVRRRTWGELKTLYR